MDYFQDLSLPLFTPVSQHDSQFLIKPNTVNSIVNWIKFKRDLYSWLGLGSGSGVTAGVEGGGYIGAKVRDLGYIWGGGEGLGLC